ncbi:MAG TPA: sugar phosphate nucleotidyltransferase [Pyrinomonadaceae bacterium]|nr:sugar phosphate nucleotidyltransferase [Pyrinomonadaceae bacterium]
MKNLNSLPKTSFANSQIRGYSTGTISDDKWAVILAGGDGSRLLPLTRKIAGDERPKQFCRIIGKGTLLDETRQRIAGTFPATKTMFVLTEKHKRFYDDILTGVPGKNLVVQPQNAGTAPAILYSLLRLEQIDPAASVAFFPSDHYFSDNRAFMSEVEYAIDAARSLRAIVLLGIEPESPDEEYGWIEPNPAFSFGETLSISPVRRFWEKPTRAIAAQLMNRGCLWNSFVMVGTVFSFLKMIRLATPELYMRFVAIRSELGTPDEENVVRNLYTGLSESNFSKDVLATRATDLAVVRVRSSKWSDLGSPFRVLSTLSKIGAAV